MSLHLIIPSILISGILTGSAVATAKEKALPIYPADVRVEPDTALLAEGRREKAEFYFPRVREADTKSAAPVVIHAGGLGVGDEARRREIHPAGHLARNGCVAMSFNDKLRKMKGQII